MTPFKVLLAVLVCSLGTSAFAATKIEKRAANFLLSKASVQTMQLFSIRSSQPIKIRNNCEEDSFSTECVEYVAGKYASQSDKQEAVRACVGNEGLACAMYVAGKYGSFSEKRDAAQACKNNDGSVCAEYVAGKYGSYSEKRDAADACANVDVECVKYTAGKYASTSEKIAAAKACGGN